MSVSPWTQVSGDRQNLALVMIFVALLILLPGGRGLHSSTFQLNLSRS